MIPSANQYAGYYNLKYGGMGAILHNLAGDLHTPMGMHFMAPLSLSNTMPGSQYAHSHSFGPLNSHFMANHTHEINPYAEQASYTPSAFIHRDPGYDAMDDLADASSINDLQVETASNTTASTDFSP